MLTMSSFARLITTSISNRTFDSPAFSLGKGSARRQSPSRATCLTKDDFSSYEPESHKDSGH